MLGPVFNASHGTPSGVPFLIFSEVLGTIAIYVGWRGKTPPSRVSSGQSRAAAIFVFSAVGGTFLWTSFAGLHRRDFGDGIAVATFLLTVGVLVTLELTQWHKFHGSGSWPIAQATVESAEVREVRTRHSHYYRAELAYSYAIGGSYYSGRFTKDFADESQAWDYAKRARAKTVGVRFHPKKFEPSRLVNEDAFAV
ncbi:MAG TPA: DUF3592 domain-containing protein [Terriglobales bacterium]|nr:DUF3592 domain-containing protein [Terriglobales bacterium]